MFTGFSKSKRLALRNGGRKASACSWVGSSTLS